MWTSGDRVLELDVVKKEICGQSSRARIVVDSRQIGGIKVYVRFKAPARDDGDGEFVRFFASVRKADRDCNIEPPASPYVIMRRAYPYRGENIGPGRISLESLTSRPRIREQNRRETDQPADLTMSDI